MARTAITTQTPNYAGTVPSYAAADGVNNMYYVNTGRTILHIKNGGASPITVTIHAPGTADGMTLAGQTVTIANAAEKMICLKNKALYDQADGTVYVDFSAATSVTVAAFDGGAA